MENEFKIGDYVSVGTDKQKGRIVNEFKPFGTFNMYTVHLFNNGTMVTAAKHELVKEWRMKSSMKCFQQPQI